MGLTDNQIIADTLCGNPFFIEIFRQKIAPQMLPPENDWIETSFLNSSTAFCVKVSIRNYQLQITNYQLNLTFQSYSILLNLIQSRYPVY
jgi:hypothetical protein